MGERKATHSGTELEHGSVHRVASTHQSDVAALAGDGLSERNDTRSTPFLDTTDDAPDHTSHDGDLDPSAFDLSEAASEIDPTNGDGVRASAQSKRRRGRKTSASAGSLAGNSGAQRKDSVDSLEEETEDVSLDPTQLYLNEIGFVPLLTA
ncbi:MAG: sigma-70 factor domain-containing protein, partial [Pseudomonadota bacterium]